MPHPGLLMQAVIAHLATELGLDSDVAEGAVGGVLYAQATPDTLGVPSEALTVDLVDAGVSPDTTPYTTYGLDVQAAIAPHDDTRLAGASRAWAAYSALHMWSEQTSDVGVVQCVANRPPLPAVRDDGTIVWAFGVSVTIEDVTDHRTA